MIVHISVAQAARLWAASPRYSICVQSPECPYCFCVGLGYNGNVVLDLIPG